MIDTRQQIGMNAGSARKTLHAVWRDIVDEPYVMAVNPRVAIERTVIINDLSFYQGETVDFVKMKNAGVKGVILRAGQNLWTDSTFELNRAKAEDAGMPWGSYFFFDSRVPAQDQADNWANILGGNYGQLDHSADYEENYGGNYGGWVNLYKFITRFQAKTSLDDIRVPVYTGYYYWLSSGKAPIGIPESMAWFANHPLWLAWYTDNPDVVKIPQPWTAVFPSFMRWQYSPKGIIDGVPGNVDMNNHNGSEENYNQFYNLTSPPPPTVTDMYTIEVTPSLDGYGIADVSRNGETVIITMKEQS